MFQNIDKDEDNSTYIDNKRNSSQYYMKAFDHKHLSNIHIH